MHRYQTNIYAMGATCSHESAALEEGTFDRYCVTCPMHQSVYDMRDGSVVHGPATYPEPAYDVRVREGMIEVRLRERPLTRRLSQTMRMVSSGH